MFRGEAADFWLPSMTYDADTKDEIIEYSPKRVENVLFGRPTTEQADASMRMYGVEAQYVLGIPKGFTASLRGCYVTRVRDGSDPVKFWIAGDPQPLPPELCPTPWNREAVAGWSHG
ncbi:MAG: hypothetical protein IJR41_01250 [Atopobiaceae bacterium]|nr:hypothetical protein [Atopobiaceae bacterium]